MAARARKRTRSSVADRTVELEPSLSALVAAEDPLVHTTAALRAAQQEAAGARAAQHEAEAAAEDARKEAARLGRENAFLAGEEKDARAELKRERAAAREAAAVAGGAVCLDSSAGVGGGEPQLVEKDHSDDV